MKIKEQDLLKIVDIANNLYKDHIKPVPHLIMFEALQKYAQQKGTEVGYQVEYKEEESYDSD